MLRRAATSKVPTGRFLNLVHSLEGGGEKGGGGEGEGEEEEEGGAEGEEGVEWGERDVVAKTDMLSGGDGGMGWILPKDGGGEGEGGGEGVFSFCFLRVSKVSRSWGSIGIFLSVIKRSSSFPSSKLLVLTAAWKKD